MVREGLHGGGVTEEALKASEAGPDGLACDGGLLYGNTVADVLGGEVVSDLLECVAVVDAEGEAGLHIEAGVCADLQLVIRLAAAHG